MKPQARLLLDQGFAECGGVVTGAVSWSGNRKHDRVGVVLSYWTQGRGDVDTAVVARCDLGADEAGDSRFRLDVPLNGPVTYHGQLLRLLWQVTVQIPVPKSARKPPTGPAMVALSVVPRGWPAAVPPARAALPQSEPPQAEPPVPPWGSPDGLGA